MARYYNSINTDTTNEESPQITCSERFHTLSTVAYTCVYNYVIVPISWILVICLLILGLLILLYVISIVLGVLCIIINTSFEKTIILFFGKAVYDKNFPVCTDTEYFAYNCYSTKQVFCS